MYKNLIKPLFDFIVSIIILIILLPLFIFVILLVKLDSDGPIFFRQNRVGKNLKRINLLKFRTMTHKQRKVGNEPIIGKAEGVTTVGYYLRRYKIDELPQLLNVIMLEMSLVGPRPNVESKLEGMSETQLKRYSVKPGLTGLAQVCGNIHLSWEERFELDLTYIKHINFLNDMKIIFRTFLLIIVGEEKFKGKKIKMK